MCVFALCTLFGFKIPLRNSAYETPDPTTGAVDSESLIPMVFQPIEPSMASLGRYGTYQVDLHNGLPQISFTLYEVNSGSLSVPIVLSYHGGGVKVSEEASWVGLGWDLNIGGSITRTVKGRADNLSDQFSNVPDLLDMLEEMEENKWYPSYGLFKDQANHTQGHSHQQDEWHYNFPKGNGMFVINNDGSPALIPYKPLKVKMIDVGGISLTQPDGTKYTFAACNETTPRRIPKYVSSWSISKIDSRDGKDAITYEYQTDGHLKQKNISYFRGYRRIEFNDPNCVGNHKRVKYEVISHTPSANVMEVESKKVKYINFATGSLEFFLSERADIDNIEVIDPLKKLEAIIIRNNNEEVVRTIHFEYSEVSDRLMLTEVYEKSPDTSVEKPIAKFEYYTGLPEKNSFATDHWGYYNGKTSNSTPISGHWEPNPNGNESIVNWVFIGGANKSSSDSHSVAGTLKKVTYPTGGSTIFEWEGHKAYTDLSTFVGVDGELKDASVSDNDVIDRFPTILNHSHTLDELELEFPEGGDDIPYGWVEAVFDCNYTQNAKLTYQAFQAITHQIGHNNYDHIELTVINATTGDEIFSSTSRYVSTVVEEYINLEAGNMYVVRLRTNCSNIKGSLSIDYYESSVEILNEKANHSIGGLRIKSMTNLDNDDSFVSKKLYDYTLPSNSERSSGYAKTDFSEILYSGNRTQYRPREICIPSDPTMASLYYLGYLSNETWLWYSNAVSGIYSSPVSYQYVAEYDVDENENIENGYTEYEYSVSLDDHIGKGIVQTNQYLRGHLINKKVYRKNADDFNLIVHENNVYEPHPGFLTKPKAYVIFQDGSADQPPTGYNTGEPNPYYSLLNFYEAHNYFYTSEWIRQTSSTIKKYSIEGTDSLTTITTYSYDNPLHGKPNSVAQTTNDQSVVRDYFYLDNTGLVTRRLHRQGDLQIKDEYLSYNSFLQMDGYKHYGHSGLLANEVNLIYDSNNRNIIEEYDNSGVSKAYIWGYNESYPVAKIENASYSQIPASLISLIQSQSNLDYDHCFSGDELCEEDLLRIELEKLLTEQGLLNAMITTYTYDPLIGLTSQTDPNGVTTYYEYDAFGRLYQVKDQDGNILNENEYNYKH